MGAIEYKKGGLLEKAGDLESNFGFTVSWYMKFVKSLKPLGISFLICHMDRWHLVNLELLWL